METTTTIAFTPPSFLNFPLFFIMYLFLYLLAYFHIFRNWTPKLRPEASSCATSLAHGTPAVILAACAILADPNRDFHSANTAFQNMVLDYSIAYFSMDLCHYLVFYPRDVLFIAHHLATLFVFITCRYWVFHGAYAILVLLILAEVTSLFQNAWTLAGARRSDVAFAAWLYEFLSPPFYVLYTLARGIAGPLFVCQMSAFYSSGKADSVIPRWVWVSWIFVIGMAICVSILWISNLWIELYRERKFRLSEKLR